MALYRMKMDYPTGPSGFDWLVYWYVSAWQPTYLDFLLNGSFKSSPWSLKEMWEISQQSSSRVKLDIQNLGGLQSHAKWLGPKDTWKDLLTQKLLKDICG